MLQNLQFDSGLKLDFFKFYFKSDLFIWGLKLDFSLLCFKSEFLLRFEMGFFCAFENLLFYCITTWKSAQTCTFVKITHQGKNVLVFWLLICFKSQMNLFCLHIPISKPPTIPTNVYFEYSNDLNVFNRSSNAHHGPLWKLHTVASEWMVFCCSLGDEFIHLISMDTQYHRSNSILCTSFPTN